MPSIVIECPHCKGTGLYQGFAEAPGTAVVCLGCAGQGWTSFEYRDFVGRRKKRGVKSIQQSRGSFVPTGVGGAGPVMSYAEFECAHPVKLQPAVGRAPSRRHR